MKIRFDFMVIDHISKEGLWFKSTTCNKKYIFYWNPLKQLFAWIINGIHFGCFPFHKNHIK